MVPKMLVARISLLATIISFNDAIGGSFEAIW